MSTKKLIRRHWLKLVLLAIIPVSALVVYGGYFFYFLREGLVGATEEERVFMRLGEILVKQAAAPGKTYPVVYYSVAAPDTCIFWTFEAVRTHCRSVGIVVKDFTEEQRGEVVRISSVVASGLAEPCAIISALPVSEQSNSSQILGCGKRSFTFTLRVQAISSKFIEAPSGGGSYVNGHIHTTKLQGKI